VIFVIYCDGIKNLLSGYASVSTRQKDHLLEDDQGHLRDTSSSAEVGLVEAAMPDVLVRDGAGTKAVRAVSMLWLPRK
jgi:hypothetical protein